MNPILLHLLLLAILSLPIAVMWQSGQPGHQATAAAWMLGLLFLSGLWLAQTIVSSLLIIRYHRHDMLKLSTVLAIHLVTAAGIAIALYLGTWIINFF